MTTYSYFCFVIECLRVHVRTPCNQITNGILECIYRRVKRDFKQIRQTTERRKFSNKTSLNLKACQYEGQSKRQQHDQTFQLLSSLFSLCMYTYIDV